VEIRISELLHWPELDDTSINSISEHAISKLWSQQARAGPNLPDALPLMSVVRERTAGFVFVVMLATRM